MSHGQAGPYEIELASGRLLDEAMDFCCTAYRRKGYIGEHTDSHPDRFYAIRKDGVLCGTIGLYMPSPNRPCFPTEAVFGYSLAQAGVDPHSAGEVGRFTGEGQLFAPIISWLALHMHADLRLRHAIFGAKPRLYRALIGWVSPSTFIRPASPTSRPYRGHFGRTSRPHPSRSS
ncbi:MAG: hypothetical protein IPG72_04060 [Ardenticatenales bacterium]|nr:hypothetical protein [Ardenticatenales bacterium]